MKTDQEKAKELIEEKAYEKLIANGYFPLETDTLQTFLHYEKEIKKLQNQLTLLEAEVYSKNPPNGIH